VLKFKIADVWQRRLNKFEKKNNLCFICSTWRQSWLRHFTTIPKVAGSIPGRAIGIFHLHKSVGPNMAFGSTQARPEMHTTNISWRERQMVSCTGNFTTFVCRLPLIQTPGTLRGCNKNVPGLFNVSFPCAARFSLSRVLKVGHISPERATSNFYGTIVTPEFASEYSLPD
jgi:hypothetical protein